MPPTKSHNRTVVVFLLFAAVGLAFVSLATYSAYDAYMLLEQGQQVPGVVIQRSWHGSDVQLVVRYRDKFDRVHFLSTKGARSPFGLSEGSTVTVIYLPSEPETSESARIKTFKPLWGLPLVLGTMGLSFAIVSALCLRAYARKRSNPSFKRTRLRRSA